MESFALIMPLAFSK